MEWIGIIAFPLIFFGYLSFHYLSKKRKYKKREIKKIIATTDSLTDGFYIVKTITDNKILSLICLDNKIEKEIETYQFTENELMKYSIFTCSISKTFINFHFQENLLFKKMGNFLERIKIINKKQ